VARLAGTTEVAESSIRVYRLYGIAISALLVGYASGFWLLSVGQFPWGVVAMGLFSNGVGAAYLFLTGAWRRAKLATFVVSSIAVGLVVASFDPELAMRPLW
jgi:hypothetical protein